MLENVMKKKVVSVFLAICLLFVPLFTSCGSANNAVAPDIQITTDDQLTYDEGAKYYSPSFAEKVQDNII